MLSLGIDIGGTFTDFVAFEDETSVISSWKSLSTPKDPCRGLFSGMDEFLAKLGVDASRIRRIVHGTTIGSNALIERKGARTAFITTKGFRDILYIGREDRYDAYDLQIRFSEPLIPRHLCVEADERTDFKGSVLKQLDEGEARRILSHLVDDLEVQSVAVSFLHSYANPLNERTLERAARDFPTISVSISSSVLPAIREYERSVTTVADAFIKPLVAEYLNKLENGLLERRFQGDLYIMSCSGGLMRPNVARSFPVRLLESGPAAGVIGANHIGRSVFSKNVLAFDMGGTTSKGCFVVGGVAEKVEEFEVARIHRFKRGSGIPIRTPALNLIEIGGGGGSIVNVDEREVLQVGPQSVGADPGPACYSLGGEEPTITDANLILGYLNPNYFLGGRMKLSLEKASSAFKTAICSRLGISTAEAAWAAYNVVNENIAAAFRLHASERGLDYRNFTMISSGGCGPMHACEVARKLMIDRVVFPLRSGVMSALGLLAAPLTFEFSKTKISTLEETNEDEYYSTFNSMLEEGKKILNNAGVDDSQIESTRRLDVRYAGQGWEVELNLGPLFDLMQCKEEFRELRSKFEHFYRALYIVSFPSAPLELVNYKMTVSGPGPQVQPNHQEVEGLKNQVKTFRSAYLGGPRFVEIPVYNRYSLTPRTILRGPAVVEEVESTCVITEKTNAEVDESLNLIVEIDNN